MRGRLVGQVEDLLRGDHEVGLDGGLVLAGGRDDLGRPDPPGLVHLVAVEEEAARRLGRPGGDAGPALPGHERLGGRPVGVDDVDRLGEGVDQLHGARHDRRVDVRPDQLGVAGGGQRLLRERVELVAGERDAGRRPDEVGPLAVERAGVERVRALDLDLLEGVPPGGRRQVDPVRGDDPAVVERVLRRVPEADEPRLAGEGRHREAGHDLHGLLGERQARRPAPPGAP